MRALTDAIQTERRATQPYSERSLGSMFTNPPGDHAGRLIDAAGLKGARVGGAEVSLKHANFVVNAGGATAADVLELCDLIQRTVAQQFGVHLVPEIAVLGEPVRRKTDDGGSSDGRGEQKGRQGTSSQGGLRRRESAIAPSTRRGQQSCPTPVPPKTMRPGGPTAASR